MPHSCFWIVDDFLTHSPSVTYYCLTNHPQMYWLKTIYSFVIFHNSHTLSDGPLEQLKVQMPLLPAVGITARHLTSM